MRLPNSLARRARLFQSVSDVARSLVEEMEARAMLTTFTASVYADINTNGRQDLGDFGVNGVTLYADYNYNGRIDAGEPSGVTGVTGDARLTVETRPFALRPDFNARVTSAPTHYFNVQAGQLVGSGYSFGVDYANTSQVMGVAYNDANNNGTADESDPANTCFVYADMNNDGMFQSTEPGTQASGPYSFKVPVGSFVLRQILKPGATQSEPTTAAGYTLNVTQPGQILGLFNFGVRTSTPVPGKTSITAVIYNDANGNGRRDAGEADVPWQNVWADYDYDGVKDFDEPSSSDGSGLTLLVDYRPFALRVLPDGTHGPSTPAAHYFNPDGKGGFQSSGNTFGLRSQITLGISISLPEAVDTGGRDRQEIFSRYFKDDYTIWVDLNHNAIRDANEPNLGNVRLSGIYPDFDIRGTFLEAGTYDIAFSANPAVGATASLVRSMTVPTFGDKAVLEVTLPPVGPAIIGTFYADLNENGIFDNYQGDVPFDDDSTLDYQGKSGLAWLDYDFDGVLDADEPSATALTTSFSANDLPGYYVLRPQAGRAFIVRATAESNSRTDGPMRLTTTTSRMSLAAGSLPYRIDLGFVAAPADTSIEMLVFNDANGNGRQDTGETGAPGQQLFADYNYNGVLDAGEPSAVTDALGRVQLPVALKPFALHLKPAAGYTVTTNDTVFFAPNPYGRFYQSADRLGVRAGAVVTPPTLAINVSTFNDINLNGRREPGESGVGGQTLFADYNYNGALDAGEPSAVTNASGSATLDVTSRPFALRAVPTTGYTTTGTGVHYFTPGGADFQASGYDIGLKSTTSTDSNITITAFNDLNLNGKQDVDEGGVELLYVFADYDRDHIRDSDEPVAYTTGAGKATLTVPNRAFDLRLGLTPDWSWEATDMITYTPDGAGRFTSAANVFAVLPRAQTNQIGAEPFVDANLNGKRDEGELVPAGLRFFADYDWDGVLDPNEATEVSFGPYGVNPLVQLRPFMLRLLPNDQYRLVGTGTQYFALYAGQLYPGIADFRVTPV